VCSGPNSDRKVPERRLPEKRGAEGEEEMQPQFDRSFGAQQAQTDAIVGQVMAKVFGWMAVGLGLSGVVAFGVASSAAAQQLVWGNRFTWMVLLAVEVGIVWFLSARIATLSPTAAKAGFVAYSAINGLTLSFIFLMYQLGSIASTFFITAGMFAAMAVYGFVTKRDLSGWGSFLFMGLIGVIIASVVNMFVSSSMLYWGITFAGVIVFVGLTAYDVQKIRAMALGGGGIHEDNIAVYGALSLYLDFINLFIMLLRIFGDRR